MARKRIAHIIFLIIIFVPALILSSCKRNEAVVEIDKDRLTIKDFLFDIYITRQEGNTLNDTYGDILGIDYWEYEVDGVSMEQISKNMILARVVYYEILARQAKKEGFSLSAAEMAASEKRVDGILSSMSDEELADTGLTRDLIIKAYNKAALADKYYAAVTSSFKIDEKAIRNAMNPDEYREYVTECIYVPTVRYVDGQILTLKEDELDEAFERIMLAKQLIKDGYDFNAVLDRIDGISYYKRSFILSDITAESEYKEAARSLNNGDYSDITITKFGYYIIHMLDNNSPSRYEEAVNTAVMNKRTSLFKAHYEMLLKDYDITINYDYWDSIDLDSFIPYGD